MTGAKRVVVAMQHAAKGKSKIESATDISHNHRPCRDRHGGDWIPGGPRNLDGNGSRVERPDVVANTEAELVVPTIVPKMVI